MRVQAESATAEEARAGPKPAWALLCIPEPSVCVYILALMLAGAATAGTALGFYWLYNPNASYYWRCEPHDSITNHVGDGWCKQDNIFNDYYMPMIALILASPGPVWLLARGGSTFHLRCAALYAVLNWFHRVVVWYNALRYLDGVEGQKFEPFSVNMLHTSSVLVTLILVVATLFLMMQRMRLLEAETMLSFNLWWMKPLAVFQGLLSAATIGSFMIQGDDGVSNPLAAATMLLACPAFLLVFRSMWLAHGIARAGAVRATSCMKHRTQRAARKLRYEMAACSAATLSTAVSLTLAGLMAILDKPPDLLSYADRVVLVIDTVCNELLAIAQSGAVFGAARGSATRQRLERQRRQRRLHARAVSLAADKAKTSEEKDWDDKVRELAGRGVSLSALLKFYSDLPMLMPQFDPDVHTTDQVVRRAIIPMTAAQMCPGSQVLMNGASVQPTKMVTHNWDNLFADLVASICSDGLGEREFFMVARLLKEDVTCLEKWVEKAGVGNRTYWVCAFAVNQHASICNNPRSRPDPVTGAVCPTCTCSRSKVFNNTPPLLPDGRSIGCEMNKFEDMMRLLLVTDPSFEQVVAISRDFKTFSRAWCVAELATANLGGMSQHIKISSADDLDQNREGLRKLRIQDMQASRKEDEEAILAGIPDHEAFNEALQKLLFEDLFPTWASLDAAEQMRDIGRTLRWVRTPVWSVDSV